MRWCALAAVLFQAISIFAIDIPKQSAYSLGSTRGRQFNSGLVFVNGKFLPPPYVVERWGVGIRINRQPVVSQVIDWTTFVKTQKSVRKTIAPANPPPPEPEIPQAEEKPEVEEQDNSPELVSSLESLFDDEPDSAKKPAVKKPKKKVKPKPKPVPQAPQVSYELDGQFAHTAATSNMLSKINAVRRDIDQHLRSGGFIFFGENYSRISGDRRSVEMILSKLPEAMSSCRSAGELSAAMRSAGLVYFTDPLCADLYRNRIDYRSLQEVRERMKNEAQLQELLKQE